VISILQTEGFKLIVFPVEASIPRKKEEEKPEPEAEVKTKTKKSPRISRKTLAIWIRTLGLLVVVILLWSN
jgi:hypothetical protein